MPVPVTCAFVVKDRQIGPLTGGVSRFEREWRRGQRGCLCVLFHPLDGIKSLPSTTREQRFPRLRLSGAHQLWRFFIILPKAGNEGRNSDAGVGGKRQFFV